MGHYAYSDIWVLLCCVLQHCLISSSFVQQKQEGAMSSGSKEVGLHCAHNWNPPESQVKMTPWQAACRRAGANSGLSCHEIQYQSQLSRTMVLQISVRLTKGCTNHKTQTTCTHISRYHQRRGYILTSNNPFHLIIRAQRRWPCTGFCLISTCQSKLTGSNGVPDTGSSLKPLRTNQHKLQLTSDMNDCSSLKQETGNHGKTLLKRLLCLPTVVTPHSKMIRFPHTVISLKSPTYTHL